MFEDGKRDVRAAFTFKTSEARVIKNTIDNSLLERARDVHADYPRVLMVFTRSDVGRARVGKRSGERVQIEDIYPKPLALMYASDLAEERIKHEIRESDENIFKKGFVVDVNVKSTNGTPVAYSVTHVHDIIDLDIED